MSNILLISDSARLHLRFASAVGGPVPTLPAGPLPEGPSQLFQLLGRGAPIPEVIVLDTAGQELDTVLELAGRFHVECPGIAVVVVSDAPDAIGLAALRAGVSDLVHPEAEHTELEQALHRALTDARSQTAVAAAEQNPDGRPSGQGRVISIVSPKGGVGKTTVATNLAVGLARSAPLSTVLVDLDVQFGDVASALNLQPDHTLLDVTRGPAAQDSMVLKTFLTQHAETGLHVVCAPASPADADTVTPDDITQLLETLAAEFRFVVVDTAPGLDEHALAAIDKTNDLVLMTSLDVPGVRGLRKELEIMRELGLGFDGRHILINMADAHSGLTKADVEATINTGVDLVLPRTRGTAASVNQGVPLLQSDTRDPMTKQLRKLVTRFAPAPVPTKSTPAPAPAPTTEPQRNGRRRFSLPSLRLTREDGLGGRHRLREKVKNVKKVKK